MLGHAVVDVAATDAGLGHALDNVQSGDNGLVSAYLHIGGLAIDGNGAAGVAKITAIAGPDVQDIELPRRRRPIRARRTAANAAGEVVPEHRRHRFARLL